MNSTDAPPTPHAVPTRRSRRGIVVTGLLVVVVGAAAWGYFRRPLEPLATPPDVELTHVEPMVAKLIQGAYERAVANPRNNSAWGEYGLALHAHGFHTQAKVCFAQAEQLDQTNPQWPYLIADCDALVSDKPSAIAGFRRAATKSARAPITLLRLGELLAEAGQPEEAEQCFREVHRTDPGDPRAHLGLARIERNRNNLRASLTHIHNCLARTGDIPPACGVLAEVYHELGEDELALDARKRATQRTNWLAWPDPYREVLGKWHTGVMAEVRRATARFNAGHRAEAETMLSNLVQTNPNSALARLWYGRTLVLQDRIADGETQFREALRLESDLVEARFYLGTALAKQAKYAEAMVEFRKVLAAQPENGDAHSNLGQCLHAVGDKEAAVAELTLAVRSVPNDRNAQKNLAILLLELRRYADSVKHFELAATLAPDDASIPPLLNRAKVAAGQHLK